MNTALLKKIGNIICYIITALTVGLVLWIASAPPSLEGDEYKMCMETANTLAPDADTKYLIQRGCFGNALIKLGQSIEHAQ